MNRTAYGSKVYDIKDGICAYIAPPGMACSNAGMVSGSHSAVFLDALGNADLTSAFRAEAELRAGKPVGMVAFTHSHGDHVFGAHAYGNIPNIATFGCKREADADPDGPSPFVVERSLVYTKEGSFRSPFQVLYEGSLTLNLGGRQVQLQDLGHCHSGNDVIAYVPEERVVFCGDILFHKIFPMGSAFSTKYTLEALDAVLALDADVFIPGHGPIATRDDVCKTKALWQLLWQQAQRAKTEGIGAIDLAEDADLGEFEAWFEPERIVQLFECMYRELDGVDTAETSPTFHIHEHRLRMARDGRRRTGKRTDSIQ